MKYFNLMTSLRGFLLIFSLIAVLSCGKQESPQQDKKVESSKAAEDETVVETEDGSKVILFFGDSLTAGYQLDASEAYTAVIQQKIDSLGYDYQVVNAGLSGDTTAGGKSRLGWVLKQDVDIFVLELGANDGLRGIPLTETRQNLQDIIDMVKAKNENTKIILAGMQIPPNMGQDYTSEFRTIFPDLAEKNNLEIIPFLLEGVAGNPDLNLEDGIHPTAEGYKIVAENVWEILESEL
jgi:acyl-CoA thioesterase-1